ncbi:MAG: hypothetical protein RRZ84_02300 [Romboutsia sp.]
MSKGSNFNEIMKFAGTYISVCIGSGFATGQEIIQFFSSHGAISILASIFCMVILAYCGASLLEIGKSVRLRSSNDIFKYLCGDKIGQLFKIFMPIFFFCSFVVMISGAGAAMNQYYGISKNLGSMILVILVLGSILLGMNRLIDILGNIGPMIVIVSIGIGIVTIARNYESLVNVNKIIEGINITRATENWWLIAPLYSGLNVIVVTPFLVGVGKTAKNKKNCILGGVIGGVAFMLAAIVLNIGLLSDIQNVYIKEIPTLYMADKISPIVGMIFSVMLIAGIYTTAVPLLWSTCSSFAKENTYKFRYMAVGCSVLGFIGGRLPFATLVNFIYPISGVMGVIIIIGIILRKTKIIVD